MTIEEKARAYDKALERVEEIIRYYKEHNRGDEAAIEDLETIFPELAESEDERIRKSLIEHLQCDVDDMTKSDCVFDFESEIKELSKYIAWLEKQGEQKPTDKDEPKFKVGDWIVSSVLGIAHIIGVNDSNEYQLEYIDGKQEFSSIDYVNYEYDEWTIQDAKHGDVLAVDSMPFIYNGIKSEVRVGVFCGFNEKHQFSFACHYVINQNITPATKEQRDLLFQKMKEGGYEWDAEKKELRKIEKQDKTVMETIPIESKPQVSCPYCKSTNCAAYIDGHWFCANCHREFYLRWSEEDDSVVACIKNLLKQCLNDEAYTSYKRWLDSLKQRMEEMRKIIL